MNKTELLAYEWLQKNEGYSAKDIIFRVRTSPDFITADGKGWEVKLARNWQVVFTKSQVAHLREHPDVTLLIWIEGRLQNALPFEDVGVPGRRGKYNFRLMEGKDGHLLTLRLPDDLGERVRVAAAESQRSMNEWLVRAAILLLQAEHVGLEVPPPSHQADTTPPDQRTATADGPGRPDFPPDSTREA